jgi:uncharacterized cofD-like protein
MKKIVVIGGGTGTFVVLSGLKKYPLDLTAVVSMADSGGSSKIIRDEFGLLPPGDVRQCLVALTDYSSDFTQKIIRQLFMYRFPQGPGTQGHTFGNLFIAALSKITGDQVEAIRQAGKLLHIKGRVLPVSLTRTNLVAKYEDGTIVREEHEIDEPKHNGRLHISKLSLQPRAVIFEKADKFIRDANLIVIGPGDLYTSLLANIVVRGVPDAIQKSRGKVVYVVNLMTKKGQTYNFTVKDHVCEMEKYLGRKIDVVIVNTGKFPSSILRKYEKEDEFPVNIDLDSLSGRNIIKKDFIAKEEVKKITGDVLRRSLIRHDPDKLARVLVKLI